MSKITSQSFSTPIATQIKPPIIKLPFIIFESEECLKIACKKLIDDYNDFLKVKSESFEIKSSNDKMKKPYSGERLFTE